MDIFAQMAEKIIKEQETIIGPVALEQAKKVPGLTIDPQNNTVRLEGDEKNVVESLVGKYKDLFGLASVQVCRDAVKSVIPQLPKDQIPPSLQV